MNIYQALYMCFYISIIALLQLSRALIFKTAQKLCHFCAIFSGYFSIAFASFFTSCSPY